MRINKNKLKRDRAKNKPSGSSSGVGKASVLKPEVFIRKCKALLELLDELPEEADDFRLSVEEKVMSLREWSEEHDWVTEPMARALNNMQQGVSRWIRD